MGSLRLQNLHWFAGLATALGCLLLGGMLLLANLEDYQRYRIGARELARFHAVLRAAHIVFAERGPANSVMGASPEKMPELAASLAAIRQRADHALAALEIQFRAERPEPPQLIELIATIRTQLAAGRAAVDAVAAQPLEQRNSAHVVRAIEEMFRAGDAVMALRDHLGRSIADVTPQVSTEIMLSTVASNMREHAGRLGSYVVMMLASPHAFDQELFRKLEGTEGRLAELRSLAVNYTGSFVATAPLQAVMTEVDRAYFSAALPFALQIAHEELSRPVRMTLADFTQRYVAGMQPLETLRELITAETLERIDRERSHALAMVVIAGGLTLFVCAALILVSVALHRMLFRPLMSAKNQIIGIAHGDLTEPAAARRIGREIQEMFDGLQVLREHQRRKQVLEQNQARMAAQLRRLSETDGLTGLLNRRALKAVAKRMLEEADKDATRTGLIIFDVDHFKVINDTHGHGVGDLVLQRISEAIPPLLRPGDAFARFGGEEFVILMPDVSADEAGPTAERLRAALARLSVRDDLELSVTASFGVAVREPGGERWDALLAIADQRLYLAKRLGRNRVSAGLEWPVARPARLHA